MYTKVKGTYDLSPEEAKKLASIERFLSQVVSLYGYEELRVPILESSELIHRSSGDSSDIVTKETYDFKDRGNRLITLRPEGTAPVIRSVIENKLYTRHLPLKLFYLGDMFRYERPQKGRFREFRQFGVECIGSSSPLMDAEVILMASTIFDALGVSNYIVRLNTLGDSLSRDNYRQALKEYFSKVKDNLSDDSKVRLEVNPLRILDSKDPRDKEFIKDAPKIGDYLSPESKEKFDSVKSYLDNMNVKYYLDERLVRGLDYYTDTIFEIELEGNDNVGQSQTICAGGRYDNLVKSLGGPDLKSVGFAFGLERLLSIVEDNADYSKKVLVQFIPIGEKPKANLIKKMQEVRLEGITSEMDYDAANLKNHFKSSSANNASFLVIQGDSELEDNTLQIKNKINDKEDYIDEDDLLDYLIRELSGGCSCGCGGHDHNHDHKCECGCGDDEHECSCHEEGHKCCCEEEK